MLFDGELRQNVLEYLLVIGADQEYIFFIYHHKVVQAADNQEFFGILLPDYGVGDSAQKNVGSFDEIPLGGLVDRAIIERIPGTYIRPSKVERNIQALEVFSITPLSIEIEGLLS